MRLKRRKYQSAEDYWHIRQFLRQVFLRNDRREICWPPYRWDYWRWVYNKHLFQFQLEAAVFIWETSDGDLAAVLHPDRPGEVFLQVHPDFCSPELDLDMIQTAETQYAIGLESGSQRLVVWVPAGDKVRQDLLTRRGYHRQDQPENLYRRCMDIPLPEISPPQGYTLRALGAESELPARSWLSWETFHRDEPEENYSGWEWYRSLQRAPLYRRDLDLVAVAPSGELAAFCTLWFDDVTRSAAYEPVGNHPKYQHLGLRHALMAEGLQRVVRLGATLVTVRSCSTATNTFYSALGFTQAESSEPWVKVW
jgi:GNAT superfamily N-acetyltransferase